MSIWPQKNRILLWSSLRTEEFPGLRIYRPAPDARAEADSSLGTEIGQERETGRTGQTVTGTGTRTIPATVEMVETETAIVELVLEATGTGTVEEWETGTTEQTEMETGTKTMAADVELALEATGKMAETTVEEVRALEAIETETVELALEATGTAIVELVLEATGTGTAKLVLEATETAIVEMALEATGTETADRQEAVTAEEAKVDLAEIGQEELPVRDREIPAEEALTHRFRQNQPATVRTKIIIKTTVMIKRM